ncbi:TetR/AcrR family transcriptional regulator [Flavobacterium sp. ZT3R18]|uniref:TetR/AcrR family transcriptional regulator n=1 Tax=Flavobacterium sp. ZT3R18 TaxID=2594429 RepID=UPI00117ACAB2|nr:TetR/AcrR family transcriptional regulator [Flavobacterium sp. ZT3R18]TRX37814.1 TetR/AcrR family transcriptional regulator [Flavobacterium sp. ZT3R18]
MDKKQIIINTATQLFVELGFHGTATSKIAQEAGVANGTLFNYFKTKDELIVTLYHSILEEMDDFIIERMSSHSISKESFQSLFVVTLFWSLDNRTQYQYMQQFNHSPYFQQIAPTILNQEEHPLFILIQNGIDIVLLKPMPAAFIFSLVTAHINGLYNYIIANDLTNEAQLELIQEAFDLLWKMIED